MAIQMRRGQLANYDKSKMLPGEWGISIDNDSDNQKAFISFAPGVSKEVMMVEDAEEQIAVATAEAIDMATEEAEAWAHGNSFHVNDYASGDGSTKSFTLAETPSSILGVYVDGSSVSAYTLSGKTITFTTAPASGSNNIRVYYTVNTTTDNAKYYLEQAEEVAESITEDYSELSDDVDQLKNALTAVEIVDSASGTIASFADGSDGVPVKGLTVYMEPIQAGSGDPSPDNVRPISGRTGVTVTRTGKNLFQTTMTSTVSGGITYTVNTDGTISLSGTASQPFAQVMIGTISLAAGSYVISDGGLGSANIETYISGESGASTKTGGSFVRSEAITNKIVYFWVNGGTNVTGKVIKPMICLASATDPTVFAPYSAQTVTIQLGQTVYGGTLDVTQGVLTVTQANITSYSGESLPGRWISSMDVYTAGGTPTTGAQVVYELATPITVQLTPQQMTTLLGQNNVWSDADSVAVDYVADTKLYIAKVIAAALS